ncbi:MAG: Na(+)-translocating NADH-quinone reductase subunit A [Gammaproteobacteria bacterium]|jgi:Na+-transporting NADH:ubiquinone oxidoreductase subunit A|uniref:Na(+)-translocating NADH-quinone reductase subunit A n=1 Tax=Marinomonas polaris DSM 16579 TaxID=1122206 RepID=A0A1M4TV92_9GAMM|nr:MULTISPECIES: Na(+)-translocating NADH-quinone reductase subunit A [Marinomonas]MBU1296992.1 Na(+)-translocating NADH-quinone reductase subunit A [Gammaproteobacteria bacterium]MBU1466389.1 Na(+)-translocating NADH-quinone reductase subunit A [Gammaproteobacteria bacterium]MBU2024415.1 Na(+)-translocating NADH-quinone reductase subunit A [Gammaproteobacteria bacterium]MBU2237284.1 Na(+)-translocating NADH-quinone reductase subunit A [Gammaproteobacteria bacterium]MBU2319674.1 Na(+)-transloc
MYKITKGLDLPISGAPNQVIETAAAAKTVAVIGPDFHGMKPTMLVKEGDKVKKGQVVFTDKKTEGVNYTSPASGTVAAINRGARRVFQSLVISVEGNESETFAAYSGSELKSLERSKVVDNLVNSGLWTSFRTRPFSKVPEIASVPNSIFVTAIDTNPLAASPEVVLADQAEAFADGLTVLTRLTEGKVFLCKAPGAKIPTTSDVTVEEFSGVHPAGLAGTHIHFLDPVSDKKTVWSINYQDVVAIGKLFVTGELSVERVIAVAGPQVKKPRLVRTQVGASLDDLLAGELAEGDNRVISGSVLSGRNAFGPFAFLGRYHNQVSVLLEGRERQMMHYLRAGVEKHSIMNVFLSKLTGKKSFDMTTTTNGSDRTMLPLGNFERVMPLDILPTQLLRALVVNDTEQAQKLGALELDDEDLALCTYSCSGKFEYGPILRDCLTLIEKEG